MEIKDDTIISVLRRSKFARDGSDKRAWDTYYLIVKYIFDCEGFLKDGIRTSMWGDGCICKGIKLTFYDEFERRKRLRLIPFANIPALKLKEIALAKLEILKKLKTESELKMSELDNKKQLEESVRGEISELAMSRFYSHTNFFFDSIKVEVENGYYTIKFEKNFDKSFDSKEKIIKWIKDYE